MDTANRIPASISPIDLYRLLGGPRAPLLLDVRKGPAFDADSRMLPSASRVPPGAIGGWSRPGTPRMVVVYCVHGHEVSQSAAAALAGRGLQALYLEGGIATWQELGLPLMDKRPDFGVPGTGPSRWITRERPKIDRIACPWLIRRFVDPQAEFLYVPTGEVLAIAAREHAVAYDIPGALLEHDGDLCSFDAVIGAFGLQDAPLAALAQIVRGADTGKSNLTPQSPGLLALSLGLSRNFPDDHAMLEHGMVMYDALYAWCRDVRDEKHNWIPTTMMA
ncbi:MAG: chromate resistance protein ChrB domain-containing protein [Betaproteobacteria bacterium]